MPEYKPPYDVKPVEEAKALAAEWEEAAHNDVIPEVSGVRDWPSAKKCIMLNALINNGRSVTVLLTVSRAGFSLV